MDPGDKHRDDNVELGAPVAGRATRLRRIARRIAVLGRCHTGQLMDRLVLPRSGSVGPQFVIPLLDDSREGIVAALEIRKDRTPTVLRKLAKAEADTRVARRILAIANALDGMSREKAARPAGMDRQTLRDWVLRYNEHGIDGPPTAGAMVGRPRSTRKSKPSLCTSCWMGLIQRPAVVRPTRSRT
jgi:hypothetical protein